MIDLHGLTLQNAWLTVRSFIDETPHRDVTIITGRGQMSVEITSWLSQCPRYQSHSVLNGGGAFRVRVRR
jgi:DNA-nicking Smr family endonuclease